MRWIKKQKNIEYKKELTRTYFAFFPVEINNEIRWLEIVHVRGSYFDSVFGITWYELEFIDTIKTT